MATHAAVPDNLDALGHTEYIPVSDLNVDSRYQRVEEIDWAQVHDIAENFNADQLEVVTVARRANGSNWLVDGQHRWLGATEHDPDFILPARVLQSQGLAWEADLYTRLNSKRKNPSIASKFKSAQVAGARFGYEAEVGVAALIDQYGITYSPWGNTTGSQNAGRQFHKTAPVLVAIGTLIKQYNWSPELLAESLGQIKDAWGDTEIQAYDRAILQGVFMFCAAHWDEFDPGVLTNKLRRTTPASVIEDAKVIKGGSARSVGACVARIVAEWYNRGRQEKDRVRDISPTQYSYAVNAFLVKERNAAMDDDAKAKRNANLKNNGRAN